jgi:FkbH-like protein
MAKATDRIVLPREDTGAQKNGRADDRLALSWLPPAVEWDQQTRTLEIETATNVWPVLVSLANARIDFIRTIAIDRLLRRHFSEIPPHGLQTEPVRLAVLGSSTVSHLLPAIRVAGLRRGIWIKAYEPPYGQYLQELTDTGSKLHQFAPTAVLFALDTRYLMRGADPAADATTAGEVLADGLAHLRECWKVSRKAFQCSVLQQAALPVFTPILGNNEHRLPGSPARLTARLNNALRDAVDEHNVSLIALDSVAAEDGLGRWHDPALWHRAKQEISPVAAPYYGELVARVIAAGQGRSFKCLVLDLDNTLWGGVIGDDGLDGIVLGQGSATGEAFVALQRYALALAKRGIILAVCSKNDPSNALAPFERHPEMALRVTDFAAFVANWSDKAGNIRAIAHQLNIGLDAMVFLDDNPFERDLVRRELPMMAVPEVPEDPALFPAVLADAGYFEGLSVTAEDRERSKQYQKNLARNVLQAQASDLTTYLRALEMQLVSRRFDKMGLQRIVQLINKTNQFNLTTRRYTEADVLGVMCDSQAFGLQLRLIDRFGDNGIVAIVIGRLDVSGDIRLDTWLMSCRVLGRQVEDATLLVIVAEARRLGGKRLIGEYRPTVKNAMVRHHYGKLGFSMIDEAADGTASYFLDLRTFVSPEVFIAIDSER